MHPDDQIITFETYYDPMLAHIIRTRLEDGGVKCFIDDSGMTLNPIYNRAGAGIKLKIFASDKEKSLAILSAPEALRDIEHTETDPETDNLVICPYCASSNIQYGMPHQKKHALSKFFSSFFAVLTPFADDKPWHCLNCQRNFG